MNWKCFLGFHDWQPHSEELSAPSDMGWLTICWNTAAYRKTIPNPGMGEKRSIVYSMRCSRCKTLRPETEQEQMKALIWSAMQRLANGEILVVDTLRYTLTFEGDKLCFAKFAAINRKRLFDALRPHMKTAKERHLGEEKYRASKGLIAAMAAPGSTV